MKVLCQDFHFSITTENFLNFSLHFYSFCHKNYLKNCFDHKFMTKKWPWKLDFSTRPSFYKAK